MTLLNEADAIHYGSDTVSAIYVGSAKVWKLAALSVSGTPVTVGSEYEHGIGSSYTSFTATASGGTPPYTYSLASGVLPAGITLNASTGVVSGVPAYQSEGVYPGIAIRATDSLGAVGKGAPFTITIEYKDPYYNDVQLLLDYSSFDGDVTFNDQKFGTVGTPRSNTRHSTFVTPLYGTSSITMAPSTFGDAIMFADSTKWNLGALPFTVDFTARLTTLNNNSVTFFIGKWGSSILSWVFYVNQNGSVAFNVSTTGSDNLNPIVSAAGMLNINVWIRWRVDYDGTDYRIYKNGVMIAKATATHTKAVVAQQLSIGSNGNGNSFNLPGNCQGIRLTVGTARTASDSGYTITNRPFPFVLIAPVNSLLPSISGPVRVGATLATTNGTWSGAPTSYTYQWKRNGTDISGATASTYTLVTADLAATISVVVTATNVVGSTTATSAGVGPILSVFSKSIDGTAGGQFSGGSSGSIQLITTQPDDVIVLLFAHESNNNPAATISSVVSSSGLTWAKRSNYAFMLGAVPCDLEIWWARAAAVLTSENIGISLTGNIDDAAYHVFGVNNCANPSSPWDSHASLATARNSGAGSSLSVAGVSSVGANPFVIGFSGTSSSVVVTNPAGTTKIRPDQNNAGGTLWCYLESFYQNNSSALSSTTYITTGSNSWGMVIDALD